MGVYNTSQAIGLFFGGAIGGWLARDLGYAAVFVFGAALMLVWLYLAARMAVPPRVRTQMFHVGTLSSLDAERLASRLTIFAGVEAVTVLPEEGAVLLKVSQTGWDEEGVLHLLHHEGNN
jgi:MFS family permease